MRLSQSLHSTPVLTLAEKVARLKQAKAEAEAEIAAYKQSREAQFQIFSKEVRRRTRLCRGRARLRPPRARGAPFSSRRPPFAAQRMGDSSVHESALSKTTEAELMQISNDVAKNKATVIDMLLKSVTTVAA